MTTFVLVVHEERQAAGVLARRLATWLRERGHEVLLPESDAHAAGLAELAVSDAEAAARAEAVVTLGGDGTMLRAVDSVASAGQPVIGVNVGTLGYLAEIEPERAEEVLEKFLAGQHTIEERMKLAVTVFAHGRPPGGVTSRALNEAVVERMLPGHTIRLRVAIDDVPFTSYAADGLIVSTATGSTAYSMSAGGPVVSPRHRAIVMTPVAPHMLFNSSLVLDPAESLTVEVAGWRTAALSVDGRSAGTLAEGDRVVIRAAPEPARFVKAGNRSFHEVLKAKFGLADR